MTGIKFLLDTNIVIGLLKGNDAVTQLLEELSIGSSGHPSIEVDN